MSTQTEHLGLHQWEAGDSFLRTDFNEDFAKIDAGVKAADAGVAEAKALAETLTANVCVTGQYTVAEDKAQVDIQLGFRPKLVFLFGKNAYLYNVGIWADGLGLVINYATDRGISDVTAIKGSFTDQVFTIDKDAHAINQIQGTSVSYAAIR